LEMPAIHQATLSHMHPSPNSLYLRVGHKAKLCIKYPKIKNKALLDEFTFVG